VPAHATPGRSGSLLATSSDPDVILGPTVHVGATPILVGTCSWTDKTLVKDTDWYPKKTMPAADRLAFYAARYPVAEADSTFYFPPTPELTQGWVDHSPAGFTMNVKAFSLLTGHPTRADALWPDIRDAIKEPFAGKRNVYADHLPDDAVDEVWRRFAFALRPLQHAGKLGAVLMQYPKWFTPRRDNREQLRRLPELLPHTDVCVEFRSPLWLGSEDDRERTTGLLKELGLSLVIVDAPPVSGLTAVLEVTNPALSVVRFHGRADDLWSARTTSAAERFRYFYDDDELREWLPRLRSLASRADKVHALMNNCYEDFGVRNAARLRDLLNQTE
jgi:uncharacterized protein YecE (DUF72 family)